MKRRYYLYLLITIIICIVIIYKTPLYTSETELVRSKYLKYKYEYFVERSIIRPSRKLCSSNSLMTIIVTSYVGHVDVRSAHRRAMPQELLGSMNISRIFLLAQIPDQEQYITQKAIEDENDIYGDILQGAFIENYRNLTHKHLMGLNWASTICNSSFILKTDDDTVFNLNKTYQLITNLKHLKDDYFLMGYILNNTEPRRSKINKWHVTRNEYSRNTYPAYLSGWYYITTPRTAAKLCEEATFHPYFWIDDIFITGILAEGLHIKLLQLPDNYWLEYYELLECCIKDMVIKNILCDYSVGPNGGRNYLILEFNEALSRCSSWQNCTTRPVDHPLNKMCVSFRERPIFSKGLAEIETVSLG